MLLCNGNYNAFTDYVKKKDNRIIIYGAGMIGQLIVPFLVKEYSLHEYVDCFIDMDEKKRGKRINIDGFQYEIRTPDYLETIGSNYVMLITNSKFFSVVNFLDSISNLNNIRGYIVPMMQIFEIERSDSIKINRITEEPMIPRIIHYCWFGGKEMPEFLKNCISSWKKLCPDYEFIEWNENNYDVNRHVYTREAYEKGKYGFVTDFARLDILYENGGIYLDTDVSLEKNLDNLLYQKGFIGTEKWGNVNTGGGCGFIKGHPMLKRIIDERDKYHFVYDDGTLNIETCGMYETRLFLECGFKPNNMLQFVNEVTIYPSYINHPYDYMSCELHKKEATVSMHHFYGGWMDEQDRINRKKTQEKYMEVKKRMIENN